MISIICYLISACAETVCHAYKDNSGSPCPFPSVSHNGECKDPGDAAACGSILGRRLVPDVFGDYSCKCDRGIGFVEYGGLCHAEYLEGPCEKGEQVVVKENRTKCMKNNCPGIAVLFRDGKCYPYDVLTNVLPSKLTTEEIAFIEGQLPLVATYSLGTFNNCAEEDSKGNCLERVVLPKVMEQEDKDFLILRSQLFPEIENYVN